MKRKPQVLCGGNNRRLYSSVVVLRKIDVYLLQSVRVEFQSIFGREKKNGKKESFGAGCLESICGCRQRANGL
jgi:hypothetical protein